MANSGVHIHPPPLLLFGINLSKHKQAAPGATLFQSFVRDMRGLRGRFSPFLFLFTRRPALASIRDGWRSVDEFSRQDK